MSLEGVETVPPDVDFSAFDEIIDVRSPGEFKEDHLPGARNLPVLDDEQRARIGLLYRRAPFQAQRLGAADISVNIARHLTEELEYCPRDWKPLLYCWRGGMRSRAFATVLRGIGWRARIVEGGYKAWRRFVRDDLERILGNSMFRFHILSGLTGSGKSHLLASLREAGAQTIDLEGLANHRGSILGSVGVQPSQKLFESRLHEALARCDPMRPVFVEAESNRIGAIQLPGALWRRFHEGVVYDVTLPLEERVRHLLEHYPHFQEDPASLKKGLEVLRRRRGNELVDAWLALVEAGDWQGFVASILENHYDRSYRRPGSEGSIYQPPSQFIDLRDTSPASLGAATGQLLSNTGAFIFR
ncbi:MAG: tRNA 2-selenouridine(34) synthase MnmH [Akkermansiaceae bacterium]|nr:tRNA 2-selenouridine(34) synthase MnmH [Akkermansiaceae bacterium]NNM30443.1 tRNA 2-selenouridine(34) synthase MnmH [Akkermansiaceae bacterium]